MAGCREVCAARGVGHKVATGTGRSCGSLPYLHQTNNTNISPKVKWERNMNVLLHWQFFYLIEIAESSQISIVTAFLTTTHLGVILLTLDIHKINRIGILTRHIYVQAMLKLVWQ